MKPSTRRVAGLGSDPPAGGPDPHPGQLPPAPRVARRPKYPTRRPSLSIQEVVEAAIAVLDEGGIAGLSMRRVAERLDTGAASLYAYVSGRDELLELVYDELIGRIAIPEPDPERWREQMTQILHDLYRVLTSHRDAALAGLGRIPTTPKSLTAAEGLAAVMRVGGLSDAVIALGLDTLVLYVSGCAFETGIYEHNGMTSDQLARYYADIHDFYETLPADRFPTLAALAHDLTDHDGDERFAFGLKVVIAGLEAVSSRTGSSGV